MNTTDTVPLADLARAMCQAAEQDPDERMHRSVVRRGGEEVLSDPYRWMEYLGSAQALVEQATLHADLIREVLAHPSAPAEQAAKARAAVTDVPPLDPKFAR